MPGFARLKNMLPMRSVPSVGPWRVFALSIAAVAVLTTAWLTARAAPLDEEWPDEADRLVKRLALPRQATVAEIGAGRGELTVEVARRLGADGRLFSTEIDDARRDDIRRAVADAKLANVTVVTAGERSSNLDDGCCDAIYMREVFHHFGDRPAMTASLRQALKPGGRLAVIDYPLPNNYGGDCHCIDKAELIRIVTAAGFEVEHQQDRWAGIRYLVVFRRGPA